MNFNKVTPWILVIITAVTLRYLWIGDMEWKADEIQMYELAKKTVLSQQVPATGLTSGVGIPNTGVSILPFALFYKINSNPVSMVQCVVWANILAWLFLLFLAERSGPDREAMMFGVGVMGVNVLAVLFSRKLWAQDLLPVFIALLWAVQRIKKIHLKYLLSGLIAVMAGQLHISGYFIAVGLLVTYTIYEGFYYKRVLWYFAGTVIGILPSLHWLLNVFSDQPTHDVHLSHIFKLEYFLHAVIDPLGFNVHYSLGKIESIQFLKGNIEGVNTYLPAILTLALLSLTIYSITKVSYTQIKEIFKINKQSEIQFNFMAFVMIPGLLLTISGTPVRSHYLIGAAPFLHAAFAKLWLLPGRRNVWWVIAIQAALTCFLLYYIHNATSISGDYGVPYRRQ